MGLTAVLTLRPSRQAADARFAAVGLAVMAEIWRSWSKELFGADTTRTALHARSRPEMA